MKDNKHHDRKLSGENVITYQRIVDIIDETIKLMGNIDNNAFLYKFVNINSMTDNRLL